MVVFAVILIDFLISIGNAMRRIFATQNLEIEKYDFITSHEIRIADYNMPSIFSSLSFFLFYLHLTSLFITYLFFAVRRVRIMYLPIYKI